MTSEDIEALYKKIQKINSSQTWLKQLIVMRGNLLLQVAQHDAAILETEKEIENDTIELQMMKQNHGVT